MKDEDGVWERVLEGLCLLIEVGKDRGAVKWGSDAEQRNGSGSSFHLPPFFRVPFGGVQTPLYLEAIG